MFLYKQDAVGVYIWVGLYYAYVKFVMCTRDMWIVQRIVYLRG